MKKLIYFAVLFAWSCDEMLTTQSGDFSVCFEKKQNEIPADGESYVKINLEFDRKLAKSELLTITTTNGHLVEIPSNDYATGVIKLEVYPDSKEYSVALVSGHFSDDDVIVGVRVAKSFKEKVARFTRVCPTELTLDLNKDNISLENAEPVIGSIELFNPSFSVSHNTKIRIIASPESLATVPPRVFYDGEALSFNILPKGKKGVVRITAVVDQEGCDQIVNSAQLEILE
ncbi:hypothetical protein Oweho_1073 [Owenweeksia hongkongensis DSM 17368]|uniref:Uncharacterized protein n=1 Tax=Owenweeksia hongkongensis (strain DSM 17368 / CIP 108786 / JCM 12287 / NRRL B-23963 / UST20020801) TaxID=926562 RepID=G8R4J1_OWEHD|nr:hypothetical protein [Owenweeksia hongkongensis]AEV32080.1 hypothetical protein Oweho_1073 [Owenweeksia hongkongensis DSM 17368]